MSGAGGMWDSDADKYWKVNAKQKKAKEQRDLIIKGLVVLFVVVMGGVVWWKKIRTNLSPEQIQCIDACGQENFYCDLICDKFKDEEPKPRTLNVCKEGCSGSAAASCAIACRRGDEHGAVESCVKVVVKNACARGMKLFAGSIAKS